jgi:hypothetical protein
MRIAGPRSRSVLVALAGFAIGLPATAQTDVKLAGRVVDVAGAPVAGVTIADNWHWNAGRYVSDHPVVTAEDGGFTLSTQTYGGPIELLALDSAGGRGGFATWSDGALAKPATVTLAPLAKVRGNLLPPKAVAAAAPYMGITHQPGGKNSRGASVSAFPGTGAFELALPPGDYGFMLAGDDLRFSFLNATLAAGKPADLGDIQLEATVLSQYAGKPPPELHVTDARGVPASVKLSDFKGKWVLLEFWGFW